MVDCVFVLIFKLKKKTLKFLEKIVKLLNLLLELISRNYTKSTQTMNLIIVGFKTIQIRTFRWTNKHLNRLTVKQMDELTNGPIQQKHWVFTSGQSTKLLHPAYVPLITHLKLL